MRMKQHVSHGLIVLLLAGGACAFTLGDERASLLEPADASQFVVRAEEGASLKFLTDTPTCIARASYVVQDYAGEEEGTGVAKCDREGGSLAVSLTLRRGYHEIRFPEANAAFGVIALDRINAPVSDFFGIDTAFSYLESSPDRRSQFVGQLTRLGIGSVRDRINWNELNPGQRAWNGSGQHQFDGMRQLYARAGIKVLDVLHGLPVGPGGYFPSSRASVAPVLQIAARWGGVWNGIEIANEPDHNRTYDNLSFEERAGYQKQYAEYASLVASDIKRAEPSVPIAGGAFAYALSGGKADSSWFADRVAGAGLLESVDVISFHTYGDPRSLRRDIGSFKDWLRRSNAPDMPLWITESGWPWKRGPGRPPLDQDQAAARQIAGKALMAYGLGIQRYYAFVYPYYEEKEKNFGMTGKERTPLRSLAAYEQLAKTLTGATPLTTVSDALNGEGLAALFKTSGGAVMVVYGNAPQKASACFDVPLKPLKIEGIDGRPLPADRRVCASDGLIYVWIDETDISKAKAIVARLSGRLQ